MEVRHLIELLSELVPNSLCKYVRSDEMCVFVRIDRTEQRLYTKTPKGDDFSFASSYLTSLAESIKENEPFSVSQLLNNKGSNRAVIDSILAHTSEIYWLQKDKSKFTVWVPSQPHTPGELCEWTDMEALSLLQKRHREKGSSCESLPKSLFPNQLIFFGAPGTGKSKTIKREVDDKGRIRMRITFHPDSDYSTFVGAYKPTKVKSKRLQRMNISMMDLAKELGNYYTNDELGKVGGIQKFCFDYYPYIDGEYMSVNVNKLLELAGIPNDYYVEIKKYIKFCHLLPKEEPDRITYEFVPQAFTNAYVEAWKTEEEVYLVIEEINRGNCAQIFGDLFQLLDRKNGVSEYPVEADADLQSYLQKALADTTRTDIPEDVKSGKKLILPSNLFIWATMNTSDQSLFPIDSAFKRRWEWKYIKIKNHPEENYQIKIGEEQKDWWEFIKKINEIIASMTSSADKQLGYFFCCAKDGVIDEETFVSKVIFYLWNDVFKDYGFEDASLFRYIDKEGTERDLTFPDFYDEDGEEVNTERLADFVKKVMSWKRTNAEQD